MTFGEGALAQDLFNNLDIHMGAKLVVKVGI
jgi:hypothetical protein